MNGRARTGPVRQELELRRLWTLADAARGGRTREPVPEVTPSSEVTPSAETPSVRSSRRTAGPLRIGGARAGAVRVGGWRGEIDELMVFDGVLSAIEARNLALPYPRRDAPP